MPFQTSEDDALARDGGLKLIRRRLIAALLVEFGVLMALAAIEVFWVGTGDGHDLGLIAIIATAAVLPPVMALMARQVLDGVVLMDTERRQLVRMYGRARSAALVDGLTGLGNHRAFQEELARQLDAARRHGTPLALLIVDVDDLKRVNDQRGHAAGDELLAAMGRIASSALRKSDRAFRIGGDEFAILLPHSHTATGLAVARRVLANALNGSDPGKLADAFSVSIGVSSYPMPSAEGHQLYRHADAALYWCKRHGRTAVVAYDPGRHGAAPDDRSVTELSTAVGEVLAGHLLRPVYQPIFSLTTGRPVGFEGLVRPADGGPFSNASALFAAAEIADRTVDLDLACLDVITAGAGALEADTYLSVNLSPRTLESDVFQVAQLVAIFRRRDIPPKQVILELTEREKVEDLEQLRKNVQACRKAGFRLAADDVGAGNAGLRLLSEIHFDVVKIDLSLVQGGILHDPSHAVLRAIKELATQWHASTVAEGVETPEQLVAIRKLGIEAGQGYLLGRPVQARHAEPLDLTALEALATPFWLAPAGASVGATAPAVTQTPSRGATATATPAPAAPAERRPRRRSGGRRLLDDAPVVVLADRPAADDRVGGVSVGDHQVKGVD